MSNIIRRTDAKRIAANAPSALKGHLPHLHGEEIHISTYPRPSLVFVYN